MVSSNVFEVVKRSELPDGVTVIDTVWAVKKKSNGKLCGRVNICGFKQIEGQHFD